MSEHGVRGPALRALTATAGALALLPCATPVRAQPAAVEEVVVTARKREERLLETPVAVSAVTAKDIESLGLANLNDITKATPGFFISNYGTQRNDRATQVLTIRGMPPSINTIPAASVFINDNESGLHHDFGKWLEELAPFDPSPTRYHHNRTGEDNADAHLKRQIMGREVVVAITAGRLDFGPWEQIFYGEFDGQRKKRVLVKIIGE